MSLEEEFKIGENDKKLLKSFFNGNRNLYNARHSEFNPGKKSKIKASFPSTALKADPRVPQIKREELKTPANLGMFMPDSPQDAFYEDKIRDIDSILDGRDVSNYNGEHKFDIKERNNFIGFENTENWQQPLNHHAPTNAYASTNHKSTNYENTSNSMKIKEYRNPEEHYYQYIDDTANNADNHIEPWGPRGGVMTREISKKTRIKQI